MAADDRPLPNYDGLPVETLRHRIRSLDEPELADLHAYERAHAHRPLVLTAVEARLEQLRAGARPSGGTQGSPPEVAGEPGRPPASPGTAAEPGTPLRHGVAGQTPRRGRP
ncbi:hypothetical protein [Actinokineospora bangkokensis]|uniref:DUF8129 domain-containing protein n=1 Tax=Actinokineospora bangkokensis TaxID=1193682 RepID=A0A1Q9LN91_9PSEU|nr:hypothetical protein [Actinokineospora bangkokensis]OLR93488.1 hypothetical protein BJP25_14370 [Actinokineospora bangkokensis]